MKEQVGVDILNIYEERPSQDATEKSFFILYSPCDYKVVEKSEYERLKRLDRHLRIKISEFIAKSRDYPMTATNNRYDDIVKSLQEILE